MSASNSTPPEGESASGCTERREREVLSFLSEQRDLLHDLVRQSADGPVSRAPEDLRRLADRADLLADMVEREVEDE